MNASPEMVRAFEAWKLAELAPHYASPCPDEVMNDLVDRASEKLVALNRMPATNADDVVLKLFPVLLWAFEPNVGAPPMLPVARADDCDERIEGLRATLSDIGRVSPQLAEAMQAPFRLAMSDWLRDGKA